MTTEKWRYLEICLREIEYIITNGRRNTLFGQAILGKRKISISSTFGRMEFLESVFLNSLERSTVLEGIDVRMPILRQEME